MATYDSLRRQARTLESVLDAKMAAYSRLGTGLGEHDASDLEVGAHDRWSDLEAEVEGLIEKVRVNLRCKLLMTCSFSIYRHIF
jgi:golgi SNAP receptor complex member 1